MKSLARTFAEQHRTLQQICEQLGLPAHRLGQRNLLRNLRAKGCPVTIVGHRALVSVGDLADFLAKCRQAPNVKRHAAALAQPQRHVDSLGEFVKGDRSVGEQGI
jgi:hypothetical protein